MIFPPVVIMSIDSETSRTRKEHLGWASPHYTRLEMATVIAVLVDFNDILTDAPEVREGKKYERFLTDTFRRRLRNTKFAHLLYAGQYDLSEYESEGEMKVKITEDIVRFSLLTKYSILTAQNLAFDWRTMIDYATLVQNGFEKGIISETPFLSGGRYAGYWFENEVYGDEDFLPGGFFGFLFRPSTTHVKVMYLVDTFAIHSFALAKTGHFLRMKKIHQNLDDDYETNKDKLLKYNLRDTEILLDLFFHFPDMIYNSMVRVEFEYLMRKAMNRFFASSNAETFRARYLGNKATSVNYTKKIKARDPEYKFEKFLENAYY